MFLTPARYTELGIKIKSTNSSDSIKESDISKIVKEDILRILGERKERVSLDFIKAEIKVSHSFVSKTIRSIKEENLIQVEDEFIRLTKKGRDEAEGIVKKHLILVNYFKETRSEREAHQAAHLARARLRGDIPICS